MAKIKIQAPKNGAIVISGLSAEDKVENGTTVTGTILSASTEEVVGKKDPSKMYALIRGKLRLAEDKRVVPCDLSEFAGKEVDTTTSFSAVKTVRKDDNGKTYHSYVVLPK